MAAAQHQQNHPMFNSGYARWETDARWYEVVVIFDLLGDWTITRRWGSKSTRQGGFRIDLAASEADAYARIKQIHKRRLSRVPPYIRVC